ncbi:hypothetical protein F0562_035111 [Nyssa sinensis]|uniref:Uncharacterized protein n=1 Tax=Nyssa sinensis TaxID=561372 RepID=A0A5J5ABT6_9ASTE|nr:hypothetical protein F0562_035111 [Nyssa sinensis]
MQESRLETLSRLSTENDEPEFNSRSIQSKAVIGSRKSKAAESRFWQDHYRSHRRTFYQVNSSIQSQIYVTAAAMCNPDCMNLRNCS